MIGTSRLSMIGYSRTERLVVPLLLILLPISIIAIPGHLIVEPSLDWLNIKVASALAICQLTSRKAEQALSLLPSNSLSHDASLHLAIDIRSNQGIAAASMSFGFGTGDIIAVSSLARTVWGRFRDSSEEFNSIQSE